MKRLIGLVLVGILLLNPAAVLAATTQSDVEDYGDVNNMKHPLMAPMTMKAASLDPSKGGQWNVAPITMPLRAIHSVVGPTGEVLLIAGSGNDKANFDAGSFKSYLWNPKTNVFTNVPTPADMFCAGHVLLPDGQALVFGGTLAYSTSSTKFKGLKNTYIFNFYTKTYTRVGDMSVGSWYPTGTKQADGKILAVSGYDQNGKPTDVTRLFDPANKTWQTLTGSPRLFPNYPSIFLTADGRMFFAGTFTPGTLTTGQPGFWNVATNAFQPVSGLKGQRFAAAAGFIGPVQNQKLIVLGGTTNVTNVINLAAADPMFGMGPSLPNAKKYVGYVNLPDGTALQANGGTADMAAAALSDVSMLNKAGTAWTTMNSLPAPHRLYHAQLYLLPDGRVVSLGSNPSDAAFDMSIDIFTPPQLLNGTRPVIKSAPSAMVRGGTYTITSQVMAGRSVASAALMVPAAVTHSTDTNQRQIDLAYSNGTVTVPASANLVPPGFYMLYITDSASNYSEASWVQIP